MKKENKILELCTMHSMVIECGDEDMYMEWIEEGVPDEPYYGILSWISDNDYEEVYHFHCALVDGYILDNHLTDDEVRQLKDLSRLRGKELYDLILKESQQ
jgi:hypothetical protein